MPKNVKEDIFLFSKLYCHTFIWLADINECGSNPCENGGTCTDVPNGYTCACQSGYTGDECQTGIC